VQNNLLTVVKQRVMDIFNDTIQRHPIYRKDNVRIRHKLASDKERPQTGLILQGASSSRIKMSADDYLTDLCSHTTLATAGDHEGVSVEWAWEDTANVTKKVEGEDVSSSLDSTRRTFTVANTPIASGFGNTKKATNFQQVVVRVNGEKVLAAGLNADTGAVVLQSPAPIGATITVSYFYKNIDLPGFYFLEMATDTEFNITPLHTVKDEVVIETTTGSELSASLDNSNVAASVFILYTKYSEFSEKLILEPGVDYTVEATGVITFLAALKAGTTLYGTYRYQGANRGPFVIEHERQGISNAITGVTMAFGSRAIAGDKQVIIVTDERETVASVYGGHYDMSFDVQAYARDPQTAQELTDHVIEDIWANKKEALKFEGLTIEELDASGESEEVYDDGTGAVYFQHSISLEIMTEWKKFKPHLLHLENFNISLHRLPDLISSQLINNRIVDTEISVSGKELEIIYPKVGYPVYF